MSSQQQRIPLLNILKHYGRRAIQYPWQVAILFIFPMLAELFDLLPQYALKNVINLLSTTSTGQMTDVVFEQLFYLFLVILSS